MDASTARHQIYHPLVMAYETIQPPFTLNFREMTKGQLKDYFDWFQEILPQRLDGLEQAVKTTLEFEGWRLDFSPTSLDRLGEWFAEQVETRRRTDDEILELEDRVSMPMEVSEEDLTNRTFSLAVDVGMYLTQVLLKSHPTLRWDQQFGNKKDVDYGQPVLVRFGPAPFNPVRLTVTLAYGIASEKKSGKGLRDLYDVWVGMIRE